MRFKPVLLSTLLACAACSPFAKKEDLPAMYGMSVPAERFRDDSVVAVAWQLAVAEPTADAPLDSARLVVRPRPHEYGVAPGAQWNDAVPILLQGLLLQGFEDSGKIAGVGRDSEGLSADFVLLTAVRRFETDLSEKPGAKAKVVLAAKLLDARRHAVVAMETFAAEIETPRKSNRGAVDAFNAAMSDLIPRIVFWSLRAGESHRTALAEKPSATDLPER